MEYCSFCGKKEEEVKKLLEGRPGISICNECIDYGREYLKKNEDSTNDTNDTIGLVKPIEIKKLLDDYVIGQESAKKDLAIAVYNHFKRSDNYHFNENNDEDDDVEIQKSNILLIGNSGTGKTLLAQTLAKVLNVPFAIADATNITESGYVGCLDRDTEYLSREGWKPIGDYDGGEIAQYNPDTEQAEFVLPIHYTKKPCDYLTRFKSNKYKRSSYKKGISQILSDEHKVVYKSKSTKKILTIKFSDMKKRHLKNKAGFDGKFITYFKAPDNEGLPINDAYLRLQVAAIADGYFVYKTHCIFRLKKKRKINRILKILKEGFIEYSIYGDTMGYTCISCTLKYDDKIYNNKYYKANSHQLNIIAEECLQWNGNCINQFYSSTEESADFIQYCFSTTGRRAFISKYLSGKNLPEYRVQVLKKGNNPSLANVGTTPVDEKILMENYKTRDGFKYCFSVFSKMFIARNDKCIFVTGNSDVETIFQPLLARHDVKDVEKSIVYIDECFLGNTLVMTNEGFKRFDSLNGFEKILQYNEDGTMDFVDYEYVCKKYSGEMVRISNKDFVHLSTKNHDRVLINSEKKLYKEKAYKAYNSFNIYNIPISGKLIGEDYDISDDCLRLGAAIYIYGKNINNSYASITLDAGNEKINNFLKDLLDNLSIHYEYYSNSSSNVLEYLIYYNLYFNKDMILSKIIDRNLIFKYSNRQRMLLIEAFKFWGGYEVNDLIKSFQISTIIRKKALLIQELCHITGMKADIFSYEKEGKYTIIIKYVDKVSQKNSFIEHIKYTGNVYCVRVPSKMIMIKQERFVQITGNCDKKARKSSSNPSITRDVSGESVQYALLKVIEGNTIDVPEVDKRKHPNKQNIVLDTSNILFILGGAFDGLENIIAKRCSSNKRVVGFKGDSTKKDLRALLNKATHKDLINYGIVPELAGRVPVISVTENLEEDDLCKILTEPKNAILKQYQKLMKMDGIDLIFEKEAVKKIAEKAYKTGNGARSLRTIVEKTMKDIMYESPSKEVKKIVITKEMINLGD